MRRGHLSRGLNKLKEGANNFWGRVFRHKEHQVQRLVVGGFLVQLRDNHKGNLVSGVSMGRMSLMRLERWPRTRSCRTQLPVDFSLCVNGIHWKVLNKGMKSDLLFAQFIGCYVKNGMQRGKSGNRGQLGDYCTGCMVIRDQWRDKGIESMYE